MGGEGTGRVDGQIRQLAEHQQGVVARRQLLRLGVPAKAVSDRLRRGFLIPVHRGVYLVGHRASAPLAFQMAAVLACGDGAVLSHRSAAAIYELLPYPAQGDVWITAPLGDHRKHSGIRSSRSVLTPADIRLVDGVPVTSPARTVLDLAAVVDDEQLERAVANGRVKGWVKEDNLRRQLVRDRGRRGAGRLRALMDRDAEPAFTRSKAERILLRLVRSAGLPEPRVNARIGPYEVDLLWDGPKVVVEFDGFASHGSPRAFRTDRERTNELQLRGYTVLRFTWHQLTRQPRLVQARIRQAFEL